jgi:Zn-dependent protease with chaperone function
MNFFEAQESARTRSRTLVVLFVAAVIAIIGAIYAVVHFSMGPGVRGGIDPALLLVVAFFTSALVAIGSAVRTVQLRQGGARVAELLGGRRIRHGSTDEAERRLINVVEEMAIASGTPLPAIFVMDNEAGINAFAAGYTVDDAAVAVTRGALDQLNRSELQGVIAHEFSHILNGDMRLNIRLMGLLFGILLLAIVGRGLMYSGGGRGRRSGGNAGQIAILGLALVAVGYIGVFFGKLIQAAVSRQREYLADAAAVQFTRDPDGISGALRKIGGVGSRLSDHHAQEAGHFFFANGVGSALTSLLATHPPLADRIRRIDTRFDAESLQQRPAPAAPAAGRAGGSVAAGMAGTAAMAGTADFAQSAPGPGAIVTGATLIASIGTPEPRHVAYAARLLDSLPERVRTAAHDSEGAVALLTALLLHRDDAEALARQQQIVQQHSAGDTLWEDALGLASDLDGLGAQARLPVLDLLLPALRELTPAQQRAVRGTARELVAADNRLDMFEFALLHVLRRQLADPGDAKGQSPSDRGARSLAALQAEVELLLSATAWSGTSDPAEARRSFDAGAAVVSRQVGDMALRARDAIRMAEVDTALGSARASAPAVRRQLLEACAVVAAHDGRIQAQEAEMMRAVAEAIDCPMPPIAS